MKQLLPNFNRKFLLPLVLMLGLTSIGQSQTVTMFTSNCTATANEFQFDVSFTNNGPGSLQFNNTVIRFTHSAAILAGGTNTIVFSYVGGSDFPLSWPPNSSPTFTYTPASRLFGVATGVAIYVNGVGCAAPNIPSGETRKLGRFSVKNNAQNFVPGADVGLTWNTTSSVTAYVNCAQATTGFNNANGNRTLSTPCTLSIPAACTSPTVNSDPTDQTVCTTGTATFTGSFTGGAPVPTLTWQVQTGGVGLFTDLTEAAPYSGTTTNTLTITNPNISLSTNRYRLKANNSCGDVFTNNALLIVNPNVNAGTVSGTSPLCIGATTTYTSNGDAGGVWSSTNPLVATVDAGGLVTAVAAGTTDITYSINSGCGSPVSAFKTLTVSPNANAGTVSGTSPLCIGATTTYTSNGDAGGVWSSTNPLVATVDAGGLVTAVAAGTTDITYTVSAGCNNPVSAFNTLTVSPNANAGTVSGTSPLCIGATTTYSSNGDAGGVWSSTNPLVATVDAGGLVTAVAAGTTDITYTVSAGCNNPVSAFNTLTVSPNANAGIVSGSLDLCLGGTSQYTSNGDAGGTWSSTNLTVATIDAGGLVTVVGEGTTDITYSINSGCGSPVSSFLTVTVNPNVTAGTVTGTSPLCFNATTSFSSDGDFGGTWSSTNTAVATVDLNSGLVTAVSQGTTNIVYTINSGCGSPVSASQSLTVQALDYANLQFPASGTICPGGSLTAYGQVYEAGVTEAAGQGAGITVDFGYSTTNSDPSTWTNWSPATFNVQVGNNDEYMGTFGAALPSGTYYYTFRYSLNGCGYQYGGYSVPGGNFWDGSNYVSGVLTISPSANAGTVSGTSPLCIGATDTYSSNGDAGGTWSSTNPLVATVDGAGLVTALLPGTTDITYTVNSGCGSPVSAFKTLTVNATANAGTISGVSPLCIGSTTTYTSDGTAGGTWSSTNPAVATVDMNTGLVTAVSAGTSDITYTVSGSCIAAASAFKTITVDPSANAGTVSGTSPLCVGNTTTYSSNGNGGGTWSSTNTLVATVNAGGVVTAVGAGTTDITYTVNTGCNSPVAAFQTLTVNGSTNLAAVAGGPSVCSNAIVQPTGTYYSDASCNAIANIVPSGPVPVAGNVNACVAVEDVVHTYHNIPYVQRHYDIVPAVNAANATATITLYYTQAEFDAFNLARGAYPAMPNDQNDVIGISNIRVTQFHGTGTYPGNYTGTSELINPADANIVWNATMSRWEITFDVSGFSGFYLFTNPTTPLPITLLNFSGRNNGNTNLLEWTTSSEQNSSYFDLQRSTDGINFVKATTVNAAGNSSTSRNYNYNDNVAAINSNLYYYRLKMVDLNGSVKYSTIVKIKLSSKGFNVEATPNPFADQLRINVETLLQENATISLTDISGKKIQQRTSLLRKGSNAILLSDLRNIAAGTYLLTVTTDSQQQTVKVIKQ